MIETFDIGRAVELMRDGKKVSRASWDGYKKNAFIFLAGGRTVPASEVRDNLIINPEFLKSKNSYALTLEPHIDMWTSKNTYATGWVATQEDILSIDWYLVEESQNV